MKIRRLGIRQKRLSGLALCTCACLVSAGVMAQDISETTTQKGPAQYETAMKSGTVVYVSGNEVVVKGDNGVVKDFTVPDSQMFTVNGQQVNVHQLKVGTHLTQTITTKTVPTTVRTVRTIEGKVWHVNPPSMVILTLPDNTNKQYKIPKGQVFMINGKEVDAFHLKKGMNVSATVVTEEPVTVVTQHAAVTGVAPAAAPPPAEPMPEQVDVLLVEVPGPAPQVTETAAAAEPAPKALPKTGSEWPLVGLLGLFSLGAGVLARRVRLAWG